MDKQEQIKDKNTITTSVTRMDIRFLLLIP